MAPITRSAVSVKMGYGSCVGSSTMAILIHFKKIDPSKFTSVMLRDKLGRIEEKEEGKKTNIDVISWNRSSESAAPVFIEGVPYFAQCDIQVWVPRSIIPHRSEVKNLGDKGAIWLFHWWLETQCWYPKRKSSQS